MTNTIANCQMRSTSPNRPKQPVEQRRASYRVHTVVRETAMRPTAASLSASGTSAELLQTSMTNSTQPRLTNTLAQ